MAIFCNLQNHADDLAAIIAKEGVTGARAALLKISLDMANEIADRLTSLAADAYEHDPLIVKPIKDTLQ